MGKVAILVLVTKVVLVVRGITFLHSGGGVIDGPTTHGGVGAS